MSKRNFMFNAVDNIVAPSGSVPTTQVVAATVVVAGPTAVTNQTYTYSASVTWANKNVGNSMVVWSIAPGAGNTGTANINQKGVVDYSAANSTDTYVVTAESVFTQDNAEQGQTIITSPSIDGGRSGAETGGYPATITPVVGSVTATVTIV